MEYDRDRQRDRKRRTARAEPKRDARLDAQQDPRQEIWPEEWVEAQREQEKQQRQAISERQALDRQAADRQGADRQNFERHVASRTRPRQGARAARRSTPGLVVSRIGKSFKRRPVVRDVSLTVRRGEIVGLLGPNGAGKTTCFYMITGLIPVDHGVIELQGEDLTDLPMYRRARMGLGYLPQEASIFRGLTVEQNIRAALELVEKSRTRQEQRLEQLMAEFSITRLRRTPAVALSGGERRRVEIARALATNPSFVLLDEPFAGVDPIAVGDIRSLVWQLKDRGIGVLITDHNVRETLEIIDRAYILHDGRVLMEGAPEDVVGDENVRRVYLGEGFRI